MRVDKREDDFNFVIHGSVNVSEITSFISTWEHEWTVDTHRQSVNLRPGEEQSQNPQKDTQAYFIANHALQWQPYEKYRNTILNKDLYEIVWPIIEELEIQHNGTHGRVFLAKLPAKKVITPHADWQEYLLVSRRNHIPVVTNANVHFTVGDETINMKTGEIWEINNSKVHGVVNDGEDDRVHLIIDIIPNELFEESDNRNRLSNGRRFL
jgi:hypothetical protein